MNDAAAATPASTLDQTPAAEQPVAVREPSAPAVHVEQTMDDFIAMALRDPSIDAGKLKALLDMKREVVADQAKVEFNQAMFRLQAKLQPMVKKGVVELGKSGGYKFLRYEDLDAVLRPLKDAEGFNQRFTTKMREGGGAVVICTLTHRGGHSETAEISLPLDAGPGRNTLQQMGSTISYGERYLTEMIFNIVRKGQDDDGKLGGVKFITEAEAAELRALATAVGQQEGSFLDQLFAGSVRSFDEIEAGSGHLACRSTLEAMKRRNEKRAAPKEQT